MDCPDNGRRNSLQLYADMLIVTIIFTQAPNLQKPQHVGPFVTLHEHASLYSHHNQSPYLSQSRVLSDSSQLEARYR